MMLWFHWKWQRVSSALVWCRNLALLVASLLKIWVLFRRKWTLWLCMKTSLWKTRDLLLVLDSLETLWTVELSQRLVTLQHVVVFHVNWCIDWIYTFLFLASYWLWRVLLVFQSVQFLRRHVFFKCILVWTLYFLRSDSLFIRLRLIKHF